jgi:hypothetical protein
MAQTLENGLDRICANSLMTMIPVTGPAFRSSLPRTEPPKRASAGTDRRANRAGRNSVLQTKRLHELAKILLRLRPIWPRSLPDQRDFGVCT